MGKDNLNLKIENLYVSFLHENKINEMDKICLLKDFMDYVKRSIKE